jgi:hypothetical protein
VLGELVDRHHLTVDKVHGKVLADFLGHDKVKDVFSEAWGELWLYDECLKHLCCLRNRSQELI